MAVSLRDAALPSCPADPWILAYHCEMTGANDLMAGYDADCNEVDGKILVGDIVAMEPDSGVGRVLVACKAVLIRCCKMEGALLSAYLASSLAPQPLAHHHLTCMGLVCL